MPEPVFRTRPGGADIEGAKPGGIEAVAEGIWQSSGLSNSFLLTSSEGRIVVNTGMGFEGPVHRENFDSIDNSPIHSVIFTQGHYDHVGGADSFVGPDTTVVAQANWEDWRRDNELLAPFRVMNSSFAWLEKTSKTIVEVMERYGSLPAQAAPIPTRIVDDRLDLTIGGRRLELHATPGGETTDSLIIWLPDEGICLCGNVFGALFGHIPNLVTMRGDRYRDALTVVESIDKVRSLGAELLLTGHFDPVRGADTIDRELTRLRDAVSYLHDETVAGMNSGTDVHTLMREISLPAELEMGEGYGKVSWDVRAIWENYAGWFHHRSTTELYSESPTASDGDLVELAGAEGIIERANTRLAEGNPVRAIQLAELVHRVDPGNRDSARVLIEAHQALLAQSTNFWETAWLRHKIEELS